MAVIKLLCCCLLYLPLRHLQVTSAYGYRVHPVTGRFSFHNGIDLRAHKDTVYAVLDGVVSAASYDRLLGIYIHLDHGDFQSSYGHLSKILVLPGDSVSAGDAIAVSGNSGRVTGSHLHFSIQFRHRAIDPLQFLLDIQNLNQNNRRQNHE